MLVVGGGERPFLSKIFQCYTASNVVTAVATATATWYSDIVL